jgi:hypothetical protein
VGPAWIEQRDDVLVTTARRSEPLTVAGPVGVRLRGSRRPGHGLDGEAGGRHPDGQAISLCDGIVRARYRRSRQAPGC